MENHAFQQLQTVKFLNHRKLGVKLVVGAFVTISEASVVPTWAVWLLGQTILLCPFQLLSLWFCDHIRPVCPRSLTATECVLRGGKAESRAQVQASCKVPKAPETRSQGWGGWGSLLVGLCPEISDQLSLPPSFSLPIST